MIQMFHIIVKTNYYDVREKETEMSIITKRILILGIIVVVAVVFGRLAVRAVVNLLLGGTLFGGDFL